MTAVAHESGDKVIEEHDDTGQAGRQPLNLPRQAFRRGAKRASMTIEQPDRSTLARRLRCFDVFAALPEQALAGILDRTRVRVFRAGEFLWRRGTPSSQAMFIEQGLAKTARRNSTGASRTYGLHGPGDSMGIYAIWSGAAYPTDAVALSDGMTVLAVDSPGLIDAARDFRDLMEPLLIEIGRFTEAFIRKIDIVSAGSIEQRLATLMIQLIERYGTLGEALGTRLPITLTLEHIGEIVDARIETVARVLGAWKRLGWLAADTSGYEFKRLDALRAMIAAE
jgi:CRP-like cAMP-binding protein